MKKVSKEAKIMVQSINRETLMEIADEIYQHVKAMPVEMANQVMDFIEFLELKHQQSASSLGNEETLYVLNNPTLMQQIERSQQTYQQGIRDISLLHWIIQMRSISFEGNTRVRQT